ncbi:hypothetical protein [Effusibacillus pohliae]|nr:hypothetical protein [Effusibacillus pohliae]
MLDKQSMLFAKPGDNEALFELSGQVFVRNFYDVVAEVFGPVDIS